MCKNRMRVAGVGLNASSCAHVRPCAMCPCNCRLATCNVRCTWRGTVWESPPDACLHICSGKVLGLLMTRWPTWWCHGLNRNWGIHSQPNEPKSQSAFTCSWVWVPFQSGTKLALLSSGFVCLFVCCSVGDCFQITLNQKQMSEIFDWFCFALPFSIPTFNVHYSAALDEIARKVRKVYWSNHRLGRLFPAEPGVCCDNASSKDKRSI